MEDEDRELVEFSTQEEVQNATWSNIHRKIFYLAEEAPICIAPMQEVFGYNSNPGVGEDVLDKRFDFDEIPDEHTRDVLKEVAYMLVPVLEKSPF